ncbi:MAG: lipid-binding SYLF domain-containing protein [Vicinamibacterales bacterium]
MTFCKMFRAAHMMAAAGMLAAGLLATTPALAAEPEGEQKRLVEAAEVLTDLMKAPDDAIPEHILDRAEAIVVIPSLVKGGFIVGGQHGKGVMSVRNRADNTWSTPGFVALTGGSFGWQIGLQSVDLVLVVMNREGVQDLLDTEFTLGGNASVAAGPVGRKAEASTDASFSAQILAYSRAKGLFAGLTLEGSSLRDDKDANEAYYGERIATEKVVLGLGPATKPEARAFVETLQRITPAGRTR